jgi:hypothetical protein
MVLASFIADSLALGVHWIYDASKIANEYGRVETFIKPKEDSYHPTKDKGEFTHYGDQQLVLLESVAAKNGFDLNDFSDRWQRLLATLTPPPKGPSEISQKETAPTTPAPLPMIWPVHLASPHLFFAILTIWRNWSRPRKSKPE